ncbi:chemotaxis protein CheW [Primorskyibacter sp. 2E233]|uniref:chemotaxis protein CheW n=1 Tax=Primorskyibacter sp. 2E233 TaxID=3413431 RepID=UPI003BF34278
MTTITDLRPDTRVHATLDVVTLGLGGEMLAIPTSHLREVLEFGAVTRVPNAAAFSAGLINVRGGVVPLCDLRLPLRMPLREADEETRVLVLELPLAGTASVIGIIAEKVHEVTRIETASLEDVPTVGSRWPPQFVNGVGRRDDAFLIMPNLDAIFAAHLPAAGAATALSC